MFFVLPVVLWVHPTFHSPISLFVTAYINPYIFITFHNFQKVYTFIVEFFPYNNAEIVRDSIYFNNSLEKLVTNEGLNNWVVMESNRIHNLFCGHSGVMETFYIFTGVVV